MPYQEITPELGIKMRCRGLIIGGPDTWKTTSMIRTADRPTCILSFPGEKGSGVIPTDQPDLKAFVWVEGDPAKTNVFQDIKEIEEITWKILSGVYGNFRTFVGDGLHKLTSHYWNREYQKQLVIYEKQITDGKTDKNGTSYLEVAKLQAYGNENYGSTKAILDYVSKVCQSSIENVVFTCWEGFETGQFGVAALDDNKNPHIFADLPGRLARRVVGEFGVKLYAEVSAPDIKGISTGTWQIRKAGKVWGVGTKVPYDIAVKLPERVPQDWQKLKKLLTGTTNES